ncbi:MAG: polysaccharide biosynthesis related protein [Caulobacter sp.]|nr:polysaccharide biosynthesis related protein [Caulobacter sp.]
MLTAPAFFGLPTLIGREVAWASSKGEFGLVAGLIRRSHQFIFCVATAMIVGAFVAQTLAGKSSAALYWALPLILIMSLAAARSAMLRGIGKVLEGQWPEQLLRPALLIGLALSWVAVGRAISPSVAVALTGLAALIALAVTMVQWAFAKPKALSGVTPVYRDMAWLKAVIPFALSTGVLVISAQISLVILGAIRGAEEVAIFRVASQTAQLCALGYTAAIMNISPRIAAAYAGGDQPVMQRIARQGAMFATAFCVPAAIVLLIGGKPLLSLMFGSTYGVGAAAMGILAVGQVLNSSFGCGASLLNMTGHERDCTIALGGGMVLQIAGSFALVPLWGATGAAIAGVLGVLGSNIVLQRMAIARTGIDPAIWSSLFHRPQV